MERTLVERTISTYGAEGDDAFRDYEIVEFLNGAYEKAVSILSKMEKNTGNVLRSLDQLRFRDVLKINRQPKAENDYNITDVMLFTPFNDIVHATYIDNINNKTRRLRELRTDQLVLLEMGNTKPNWNESFYHLTGTHTGKTMEIFAEDISVADEIRIYYIRVPDSITDGSRELPNLPPYLSDAVINGACEKMALKTEDRNADSFRNKFLSELKNNAV